MKKILMILLAAWIGHSAFGETEKYEGFEMDRVLSLGSWTGDLHYHLYVPESYDGGDPYALYISLPGYGSYYFQGVGVNLRNEPYVREAKKYNVQMIIAAPQPEDWGQNSKRQIIALTEYLLEHYNVDRQMVYISGYSGGGETLSLVIGERPELFTAALHISSRWDGEYEKLVAAGTPVYFVIGENDEYYTSLSVREAYGHLRALYRKAGLSEQQVSRVAVLDIKDSHYFATRHMANQHGGGSLFAYDRNIMGWLFGEHSYSHNE